MKYAIEDTKRENVMILMIPRNSNLKHRIVELPSKVPKIRNGPVTIPKRHTNK